jgi:hypothetical protein
MTSSTPNHPSNIGGEDRITKLIQVTEERTRMEERVANMLREARECDRDILAELRSMREDLAQLLVKIEVVLSNSVLLAQLIGAWASDDHGRMDRLQDRIVNGWASRGERDIHIDSGGVRFGDRSDVDVGGDMIGGDKEDG